MNTSILEDSILIEVKQGYNNVVEIRRSSLGQKFIYKSQGPSPVMRPHLSELTPFLYQHRIKKEVAICTLLQLYLPVPSCSLLNRLDPPVAIFEFVEGDEVTVEWLRHLNNGERLKFSTSLGELVAKLQRVQDEELLQQLADACDSGLGEDVRDQHRQRASKSLQLLEREKVLTTSQAEKMRNIITTLFPKVPHSFPKLIHGDIYFGNIFVDQSLAITGLIDWADASEIGDPLLELVLTARWLAFGEFYEDWDDPRCHDYFDATIMSFNNSVSTGFELQLCKDLMVLYEVLWHCKVLIAEHGKNNHANVAHFCHTLEKTLETHGF